MNVPGFLVGDSEFGTLPVIRQLDEWHWDDVLWQRVNHQVKPTSSNAWLRRGIRCRRTSAACGLKRCSET